MRVVVNPFLEDLKLQCDALAKEYWETARSIKESARAALGVILDVRLPEEMSVTKYLQTYGTLKGYTGPLIMKSNRQILISNLSDAQVQSITTNWTRYPDTSKWVVPSRPELSKQMRGGIT